MRANQPWLKGVWTALGFVLMAVGLVGAFIPFTFHLLAVFLVIGLVLVLRNSRAWRRRFVRFQKRHPRWGVPLRRLLRRKPEVAPVVWHEVLRTERWVIPRSWRRLARWRRRWRALRRARRRAPV